jgi:hypothetical protein
MKKHASWLRVQPAKAGLSSSSSSRRGPRPSRRFFSTNDDPILRDFRASWKNSPLTTQRKHYRLNSFFDFCIEAQEIELLQKALAQMQAADRGLRRLHVVLEKTGSEQLAAVLQPLNLRSLDHVGNLEPCTRLFTFDRALKSRGANVLVL